MWLRHWNLNRNPFDDRQASFVELPGPTPRRWLDWSTRSSRPGDRHGLVAGPGLGKSTVLSRALEVTRSPGRRFSRVTGPVDGPELFASLAAGLGAKVVPDASRSTAWRILGESARLCRWQGLHLVLSIDDCQGLANPSSRLDLERLDHLDPDPSTKLTILRIGRPSEVDESPSSDWGLSIRLEPLTRSEASSYVEARLETSGRSEPTFTPRALTRLHALSGGVPRGIDRLATLSLMAAASRRLEVVPPEVVEAISREYLPITAAPSDA